jgi:hypothetical protein
MTENRLIEILTLENQFEANRMRIVLEEQKIPFIIKEYSDLEYGNIKGKRGWGRLESYKEYEQDILDLYKQGFQSKPVNEQFTDETKDDGEQDTYEASKINRGKKSKTKEIILVVLLLSTSFLGFKVYDLNRIINRPSIDKNFTHIHGRYSFRMQWKSSGKDYLLEEDEHGTGLFNKISFSDPKGILVFLAFDEDQDGIREKTIMFDTNKDTLGITYDQNGDGIGDKSTIRFNKDFNLTFQDINFDRKCDSVFVNHKSYSVEQFMEKLK